MIVHGTGDRNVDISYAERVVGTINESLVIA